MFEKASRMKLRFNYKGVCSVEDLWDLPLSKLDNIYKELSREKRDSEGDSLLEDRKEGDDERDLQMSIVKHIVEVRLAERDAAKELKEKKEKKQKLLGIISEKQDQQLRDMPVEDLVKLVESL